MFEEEHWSEAEGSLTTGHHGAILAFLVLLLVVVLFVGSRLI